MQLKFVSIWVDDSINNSSVVISISPFHFRLDSLFFLIYVISIDEMMEFGQSTLPTQKCSILSKFFFDVA